MNPSPPGTSPGTRCLLVGRPVTDLEELLEDSALARALRGM